MAASHTEVWQAGTVARSEQLTADIRRIEIDVDAPVRVAPGAHVDVRLEIGGTPDRRSYSVVDATADGARIALSVFASPRSRGGAAVMHALATGDRVELTQPVNDFPVRIGAARYVLLAGGIGVTAILGMASLLRSVGADYELVYAGRSRTAMAYLDRLRAEHGDRLALHIGDEGTSLAVHELVAGVDARTELYMCGPIRLMDAVRRAWIERELPSANLRFETFGNSGWHAPEEFTVRVPALGLEARVGAAQSMLEALEQAGADMLYDCRKGECGLCEVRVLELEGDLDHRDVFYSERQKNARAKMCCCVSRAVAPDGAPRGTGVVTIVTT